MAKATTKIETKEGVSYIRKLCRHFVNKVPATYTETQGRVEFPIADAELTASLEDLQITINAPDEAAVLQAQGVVERHLVKFAFREQLEIKWIPA